MIQVYSSNCFYLALKSGLFIPRQDKEINITISKDVHFIGICSNNTFPFKGNYKVIEEKNRQNIFIPKESIASNKEIEVFLLFGSKNEFYRKKLIIEGTKGGGKSYLMNQNEKNNKIVFELKNYLNDYSAFLKLGLSCILAVGGYYIFSHQFNKQYNNCRTYF